MARALLELPYFQRIIALMHDIHNRIADVLLEVEATLRVTDKWDRNEPDNDRSGESGTLLYGYAEI